MKLNRLLSVSAVVLAGLLAPQASAVQVKLELALLVDVSGSVSGTEYLAQRDGYISAFQSVAIKNLIAASAADGGIAVTYIEWSSAAQQSQKVGWTQLKTAADADAFAAAILAANLGARAFSGNTAPGDAINFVTPQFESNAFEGAQKVIDVSGDGAENVGADTSDARDAALAAGVNRINGLAILGEGGLEAWYNSNIKGGSGAFVLPATFDTFGSALQTKLDFEITNRGVPDGGSTLMLLSAVLGALGLMQRRKFLS